MIDGRENCAPAFDFLYLRTPIELAQLVPNELCEGGMQLC